MEINNGSMWLLLGRVCNGLTTFVYGLNMHSMFKFNAWPDENKKIIDDVVNTSTNATFF